MIEFILFAVLFESIAIGCLVWLIKDKIKEEDKGKDK